MTKLNGVLSLGSVVKYGEEKCVISDVSTTLDLVGGTFYDISRIKGSCGFGCVGENQLEIITAKSPLKKHLTKLNSLDKKIAKLEVVLAKEMKKVEKKNGWDDSSIPYDSYDNEHSFVLDGISYGLGLDDLHDARYNLIQEMVASARIVKS